MSHPYDCLGGAGAPAQAAMFPMSHLDQKRQIQASGCTCQIGIKHTESEVGVTAADTANSLGGRQMNAVVAAQSVSCAKLTRAPK